MSDSRDSATFKHFKSRAQQPKVLTGDGSLYQPNSPASPVNIAIVFDTPFSSVSDDLESLQFRYIGVPQLVGPYNGYCAKKNKYESMKSAFQY